MKDRIRIPQIQKLCTAWRQRLNNIIWNVKDFFCPLGSLAQIKWKSWALLKFRFCHSVIYTFTYKSKISFSLWLKMKPQQKTSCIRTFWNPFVARTKKSVGVDSFFRNHAYQVGVGLSFCYLQLMFPNVIAKFFNVSICWQICFYFLQSVCISKCACTRRHAGGRDHINKSPFEMNMP